ncbi:MAG: hypothetical protein JST89_01570 [Cyanobacteria bacterium SZAS-4]|nr:hypothetical protein [Cyanobacteria bacterium SZAS-4]
MTSHKIDGKWRGHYTYSSSPDSGSSFDARFEDRKGALSGDIVDDEWLGPALIVGSFSFPDVSFTKQYTKLKASTIDYKGTMSGDGKTMSGTWVIFDSRYPLRGTWHAYRADQQAEKRQAKTSAVKEKPEEVF